LAERLHANEVESSNKQRAKDEINQITLYNSNLFMSQCAPVWFWTEKHHFSGRRQPPPGLQLRWWCTVCDFLFLEDEEEQEAENSSTFSESVSVRSVGHLSHCSRQPVRKKTGIYFLQFVDGSQLLCLRLRPH